MERGREEIEEEQTEEGNKRERRKGKKRKWEEAEANWKLEERPVKEEI